MNFVPHSFVPITKRYQSDESEEREMGGYT